MQIEHPELYNIDETCSGQVYRTNVSGRVLFRMRSNQKAGGLKFVDLNTGEVLDSDDFSGIVRFEHYPDAKVVMR